MMTFFRLTTTSALLVDGQAPGDRRLRGRGPPGVANRFVPWVTQVPAGPGATRRPVADAPDRSLAGQQVLARRPEWQVGVEPLAQVEQLQLLGQQPGGVHGPHD